MTRHIPGQQKNPPSFGKLFVLFMILVALVAGPGLGSPAEAKKKKAKEDNSAAQVEAELKKELDPLTEQLNKLMVRVESRALLSPNEAGQLVDVKYKLLDILSKNPTNPLLARPVYQAAMLYNAREEYPDAYELFTYLSQSFPATPYGIKAKGQMQQLKKRFGADYFPVDTPIAQTAEAPATDAAKTGEKAATPEKK